MFSRMVDVEEAARLLDLDDRAELDRAVAEGALEVGKKGKDGDRLRLSDVVVFKLAAEMRHVGVDRHKSFRYAEAVLGQRLETHDRNPVDWVENEEQELFCLIEDGQLTRIFLRGKEDPREVDVGAVKPVLFPVTRCEINVFRVIRPVIYKARQMDNSK
jgi:hypothetical protein